MPGMPDGASRVAIIAPMPNELRPVVKMLGLGRSGDLDGAPLYEGDVGTTHVVATRTGIGPERAATATERLLATTAVDRVVVSGIAGGVEPLSSVGDLIVPEEVIDKATGDRFRATPVEGVALKGVIRTGDATEYELDEAEIARLRSDGIAGLDMETAAIARVCQDRGVPWLAFRAISDMAGDPSVGPVVMTLVNPDGSPRPWAAIRFLVTHPGRIPRMVRLGREADAAARAAARAAVRTVG